MRKFKTRTRLLQIIGKKWHLNFGRDVANNRESRLLYEATEMVRYGSLINMNPSDLIQQEI